MELAQSEPRKPTATLLLLAAGMLVGMLIHVVATLSLVGIVVSLACVLVAAIVALKRMGLGKNAAPQMLAAATWGLVAMTIGSVAGLVSLVYEFEGSQDVTSTVVVVLACLQIGVSLLLMIPLLVMRASARRALGDYSDDTLTPPLSMP